MIKSQLKKIIGPKIYDWLVYHKDCFKAPKIRVLQTKHYQHDSGIFHFKGTFFEVGKQIATTFDLKNSYSQYERQYLQDSKATEIELFKCFLQARFSEYYELLSGIADTYKMHINTIVAFNISPILMNHAQQECSSAYFPKLNILIQNLDVGLTNEIVPVRFSFSNGVSIFGNLNLPYIWVNFGFNNSGLFFSGSAVNVINKKSSTKASLPFFLMPFYFFLKASSIADVHHLLNSVTRAPENAGSNVIIGEFKNNVAVQYEISPTHYQLIEDNHGEPLVTTNHFRSHSFSPLNDLETTVSKQLYQNSLDRYHSFQEHLLLSSSVKIQQFLRNSEGVGAWCRNNIGNNIGYTSVSYFVDFNHKLCRYSIGFPQKKYLDHKVPLGDFFE